MGGGHCLERKGKIMSLDCGLLRSDDHDDASYFMMMMQATSLPDHYSVKAFASCLSIWSLVASVYGVV